MLFLKFLGCFYVVCEHVFFWFEPEGSGLGFKCLGFKGLVSRGLGLIGFRISGFGFKA